MIGKPPHYSKSFSSLNEPTSVIRFLIENQAKYILICQSKDQSNRGYLPYDDFIQAIRSLETPNLTDEVINRLISITSSRSANKIRYVDFIEALSKKSPMKKTVAKASAASDITANYDRSAIIPIASLIWDKKLVIIELSESNGMRPRVALIPSELLTLLKKSGIHINIHQLKAVLREGNLTSASPLDLIKTVKSVVNPTMDTSIFSDAASEVSGSRPNSAVVYDDAIEKARNFLRGHDLQLVYQEASSENELDVDGFVN